MIPIQIGRYKIIRELGRGGMAIVYQATDPAFNRTVAIKILPRQFTHDPTFRGRFKREAQTIALLEHPAIVPVYDFGEEGDQPYLVMKFMDGGSLADKISKGTIPLEEVVEIVGRISSAMDKAHSKKIVHRDLKPENILFDEYNNAFLSDFGIVKLAESTSNYTGAALIGTPAYMSPEQARGNHSIDGKSDIYSFGIVIFEMITGRIPYKAETPAQQLVAHLIEPIPDILSLKKDLPEKWDQIIKKVLAKEPKNRYQTAKALADDIKIISQMPASNFQKTVLLDESFSKEDSPKYENKKRSALQTVKKWWWLLLIPIVIGTLFLSGDGFGSSIWGKGEDDVPTATAVVLTNPLPSPDTPTTRPTNTQIPTTTPTRTPTTNPSPTRTRTSTPTKTVVSCPEIQLTVTSNSVNVRTGPGTNYSVQSGLFKGDTATIIASFNNDGEWYNIALNSGSGVAGWVFSSFVEVVPDCQNIEIPIVETVPATAPPTNTPVPPTNTPMPSGNNGNDSGGGNNGGGGGSQPTATSIPPTSYP